MAKTIRKKPRVVKVKEYTRKDGTVVEEHKRTKPDGIEENNHSYKG